MRRIHGAPVNSRAVKRIVYAVAVGSPKFGEMAMGLGRSLKLIGDETRRVLVTDIPGFAWKRVYDEVLPPSGPRSALDKLFACERTDADQVLSIDVDMLAFRRLDPIFDWCNGRAFAVQGYLTAEGSFHRQPIPKVLAQYGVKEMPQFNGGLAYYERGPEWDAMLAQMRRAEANYGDLGFEGFRGGKSEEVCMLDAMLKVGHYHLMPPSLQFQHSAAGLVGKLHLDVLTNRCEFIARQRTVEFVRPFLFHAWRYKDFRVYWRELRKLKRLERYEDTHPSMWISRPERWKRSLHTRWQKLRGWKV